MNPFFAVTLLAAASLTNAAQKNDIRASGSGLSGSPSSAGVGGMPGVSMGGPGMLPSLGATSGSFGSTGGSLAAPGGGASFTFSGAPVHPHFFGASSPSRLGGAIGGSSVSVLPGQTGGGNGVTGGVGGSAVYPGSAGSRLHGSFGNMFGGQLYNPYFTGFGVYPGNWASQSLGGYGESTLGGLHGYPGYFYGGYYPGYGDGYGSYGSGYIPGGNIVYGFPGAGFGVGGGSFAGGMSQRPQSLAGGASSASLGSASLRSSSGASSSGSRRSS